MFYCGNQWGYTPLGNLIDIPTGFCNVPTQLQTAVIGQHVTFSWTAPHDFDHFVLEYRLAGSMGAYTAVNVFGQSYTASLVGVTEYEWRVKTYCSAINESAYANGTNVTTQAAFPACTPVSSVQITNMGTFYRVSWTGTGAQYYKVTWYTPSLTPTIFEGTTQELLFDLPSLTENADYEVVVTAYCADPTLLPIGSTPVQFTAGSTVCPSPGTINYTISSTSIIIGWPGIMGAKYNIYLNNVLVAANYPMTTFSFTGLTPDTEYTIAVRTNCQNGFSEPSIQVLRTQQAVCNNPSGLNFTGITSTGFTANWTPGSGIASQQIILDNGTPLALLVGANSHAFTGLPSGSNHTVMVRSVCATSASSGISSVVQLLGCSPITNLVVDNFSTHFNIKWTQVSNAAKYVVSVKRNSDNVVVFTGETILGKITASPLEVSTAYTVSVTAYCGAEGSELIASTPVTSVVSTLSADVCENATITSQVLGQNSMTFNFNFASGLQFGNIRAILRKTSDSSLVGYEEFTSSPGTVTFPDLIAGTSYRVYIFNLTEVNGVFCTPAILATVSTTATCAPPSAITLAFDANDTEIDVNATPSPSTPTDYAAEYRVGDGPWISLGNQSLPFTITGLVPGRYQVRLRSNCVGSISAWVNSSYLCSVPVLDHVAIQQNTAGIYWAPLAGVNKYLVEISSLSGGTATYTALTNSIDIPNLAYNTNFVAKIKTVCVEDPLTTADSASFGFATGDPPVTGASAGLCQPVDFTAVIQDCEISDPKGTIHAEEPPAVPIPNPPSGGSSGCQVTEKDFALISGIFMDVDDPPNDQFFEGTFSQQQTADNGDVVLMPGGVIGNVSVECRPASTATLQLEVIQGGTYIAGDGSLATNGDITLTGSYTSNGGTTLIIRVKGNYIKA